MESQFDPYRDWLRIAAPARPPTHYELLGLAPFEADSRKFQPAASERIAHVRKYQAGKHSDAAIRLMNEISQALTCLTDPASKAAYDRELRGFATVEDAAAEALSKTLTEVPPADSESMPPLPRELAGANGRVLETLSAAVAAMEPPPGAAAYVESATARVPVDVKPARNPVPVAVVSALAFLLLISVVGGYALYRLVAQVRPTQVEQIVDSVPASPARPEPPAPADSTGNVSTPAPNTQPVPRANGLPPQTPAPALAPTAPPVAPSQHLLKLGMSGSWEGKLAEIYIDPTEPKQQANLLLKLDALPDESVEVISNDYGAFLALFAFVSDAETSGQGDRVRIEGTVTDRGPLFFAQRTAPLAIQMTALGPIGESPTYRAGAVPPSIASMKLKTPLSFLMRMRPEPGLVYEFPAVYQSSSGNRLGTGPDVRVTPGPPDARVVSGSFGGANRQLGIFDTGDAVILQAEVTEEALPPKLSLHIRHMRKSNDPNAEAGQRLQEGFVNVEKNMALSPLMAGGAFSGTGSAPGALPVPGMAPAPGTIGPLGTPTANLSGAPGAAVPPAAGANLSPPEMKIASADRGEPPLVTLKDNGSSEGKDNFFQQLIWSPDGTRLASVGARCILWDPATGAPVRSLPDNLGTLGELQFSPSSQLLSLIDSGNMWKLYDLGPGNATAPLKVFGMASGFRTAFNRSGEVFVAGAIDANQVVPVLVWDAAKNRKVDEIKNLAGGQSLALSRDGRNLLIGAPLSLSLSKQMSGKWTTPQPVATVPGIQGLWWLGRSQNQFAVLTNNNLIGVWDAKNLKKNAFFSARVQPPVSWTSDGKRLVCVAQGVPVVQTVVTNTKAGINPAGTAVSPLPTPMADPAAVMCQFAVFSPANHCLAAGYSDGRIVLRDEHANTELATITSPGPLSALAWSPQGDRLATAHFGAIYLWDTSKFTEPVQGPDPAEAPEAPTTAAADLRDDVASQIMQAQKAIIDKDWATANNIWQTLEGMDLNAAEKAAVSSRIKKALTLKADLLVQQANRLKVQDPDKAAELLGEAMQIDPEGPAGKKAAKLLGL